MLATRLGVTQPLTTLVDGEPRPLLATAWTQTSPTTWRFTVRPGVTFHDGSPLTPAAVANALNRAAAATPVPRAISSLKKAGTALAVVPDGDGVVVTTPVPDPVLPNRLASPELVVLGEAAYANPARPSPVRAGTGPFVLTGVQGSTGATLDRNPAYWGGPVAAPGVDARFLADGSARANGIRAGELDVADAIPVSAAASVTGDAAERSSTSETEPARVVGVPLPRSVAVYLDQRSPVLADPGLRAAVREALRPLDVAGTVFEGRADPAAALFGPATPWAATRPPRTDVAPTPPNGARIRLATYGNRPELPEVAAADADALRRAGFTVDLTVVDSAALEAQLGTGAYDAVIISRSQQLDTGDPVSYLAADFGCSGSYNWARFCDPATDAVLAAGRRHHRPRRPPAGGAAGRGPGALRGRRGPAGHRARPARRRRRRHRGGGGPDGARADHGDDGPAVTTAGAPAVLRPVLAVGGAVVGIAVLVAALPWLWDQDPAASVLRTRYAERGTDPEALEAIRRELDLPANPVVGAAEWLGGLVRGDLGTSWVGRSPVAPDVLGALGISLTLSLSATVVAAVVAAALLLPALLAGARGRGGARGAGVVAAVLAAFPEIVLGSVLVLLVAVQARLLPTSGFSGPEYLVLPALALGVPAGGLLARLLSASVDATLDEGWVRTWRSLGVPVSTLVGGVARRAVAVAVPQVALLVVGLLGAAVAVEQLFSIPGHRIDRPGRRAGPGPADGPGRDHPARAAGPRARRPRGAGPPGAARARPHRPGARRRRDRRRPPAARHSVLRGRGRRPGAARGRRAAP